MGHVVTKNESHFSVEVIQMLNVQKVYLQYTHIKYAHDMHIYLKKEIFIEHNIYGIILIILFKCT